MSYEALVCYLTTEPHPNADKLVIGNIAGGYRVITSKDTPSGSLGLFFEANTQLSEEFCLFNRLYIKHPATGEPMGGYIRENRRVQAIKLRGISSDGLWMPLKCLEYISKDLSGLKPGQLIDTYADQRFCQRYESPVKVKVRGPSNQVKQKKVSAFINFKKHFDTSPLRKCIAGIPEGANLIITEKLHGTSARSSYALKVTTEHSWWRRLLRMKPKVTNSYESAYGSRNVIFDGKKQVLSANDHTKDEPVKVNYREHHHNRFALHKGETVYYEIVGYEYGGKPIMPGHNIDDPKDPVKTELKKKLGINEINYHYGCPENTSEIYVYRITLTNEDGYTLEYSWDQVCARCEQLGLKTVPWIMSFNHVNEDHLINRIACIEQSQNSLLGNPIMEGICVKVESSTLNTIYKDKFFTFKYLEGIAIDNGVVDTEEIS